MKAPGTLLPSFSLAAAVLTLAVFAAHAGGTAGPDEVVIHKNVLRMLVQSDSDLQAMCQRLWMKPWGKEGGTMVVSRDSPIECKVMWRRIGWRVEFPQ